MSEKKLFASDFDGTLSECGKGVTEKSICMIERFRSEGNFFGVITGRNINNLEEIYSSLRGRVDFIMCMTGAYAADGEGNYIFDYKGDGSALPELFRAVIGDGAQYLFWADMEKSYDVDVVDPLDGDSPALAEARRHRHFSQLNTRFSTEEETARAVEHLLKDFGDKVNPQINGLCVDIPPAGVSKGEAVLRMAEHFGVKKENIFTAGDNINDVPMLKMHYGFSLPGGKPQAKAAAREILPDVGDMLRSIMEKDRKAENRHTAN